MAAEHTPHHHGGLRPLEHIVNAFVSDIALYGALIMTITSVVLAFTRIYILDNLLLGTFYRSVPKDSLNDTQRRSFINHHVAAVLKVLLIVLAAYPLLRILAGNATPQTPYAHGSKVTLGDILMVASQIFSIMYIFELFYREKVSPISFAHHVGAILIAQAAVAMTINFDHQKDAVPEFLLCLVWGMFLTSLSFVNAHLKRSAMLTFYVPGAFDCIAELWPHIAMILYRTNKTDHGLLYKVFSATMILEIAGTAIETAVTMWLFGSLWHRWSLSLKIVTPILHLLFSSAQLWGAYIFRNLAAEQRLKMEKAKETV